MKGTEQFIRTIAEYPNGRAMTDPLFAPNLQKPHKNIEECILYILSEVQRSGCNGFADEEIYSMAVHYYDEDDIAVDKVAGCNVVVNHVVELSEEEKKQYQQEKLVKLQKRNERPKRTERTETTSATQPQPTLFDTLAL
ncbi:PcfK-like family protein [Porphyromonas uenonis]|uniref:PcfK-like family protein n=1 Tax=Porphyromonas uenonis TaxID=281920 RepID=UPI0005867BFA|nr:PcfK-like family protein [Porphyromonas uenonis]